jgi:hypothetical protein
MDRLGLNAGLAIIALVTTTAIAADQQSAGSCVHDAERAGGAAAVRSGAAGAGYEEVARQASGPFHRTLSVGG